MTLLDSLSDKFKLLIQSYLPAYVCFFEILKGLHKFTKNKLKTLDIRK